MEHLATIRHEDIFPGEDEIMKNPESWQAARAIVFDEDQRIGILNVKKHRYHKLPGGGIEEGEDIKEALKREAMEEIGCQVNITGEIGEIIECRTRFNLLQKSFCYTAEIIGEKGSPTFTEEERGNEFEILWVTIDEAIDILQKDKTEDYEGKFILKRDLIFLKNYKQINFVN
jgi:8-oxo-dGTP diphosphatase